MTLLLLFKLLHIYSLIEDSVDCWSCSSSNSYNLLSVKCLQNKVALYMDFKEQSIKSFGLWILFIR